MEVRKFSQMLCLLVASGGTAWGLPAIPSSMEAMQITAQADKLSIQSTIVDAEGQPLIGVSILEKGTTNGTITDLDGAFTLSVSPSAQLEISYVGYKTLQIPAKSVTNKIVMHEDTEVLEEVVVTALGIKRSEKALSYNVQEIGNESLTTVKDANFMNSLSGKVAGVNINASSSGMGGATRVVMRGPKSISQSNQALYVVDGVPLGNHSGGDVSKDGMYSNQPGGEGIADINPEDIESISVLSGPAAAALYGSAAAQGVIMITTKKGKEGKVSVTITNSSQFSNPFKMPKFQNEYVNRPGQFASWGEKRPSEFGDFDPEEFFNTGSNIQNNVALTVGSDKSQTYMSVGSTNAAGIIPNNKYERYNWSFRNTTNFLNDKLTLDFGFNYIYSKDRNLMAQGQYFNPLVPLYLFPRGESFDAIRTFEIWDPSRGIHVQNWNYGNALSMQNPYWVAYRMDRPNKRHRYMVNASLKYQILDWLDVAGRLRFDRTTTKSEHKRYASTNTLFTGGSPYGFYRYTNADDQNLYGDLMVNINKRFNDFSIGANLGASMTRTQYNLDGFQGGLRAPSNLFTPDAIDYGHASNDNRSEYEHHKHYINSLFANVELGWKNMVYLTLTGRNDWDSALAGTTNESFFYPSVGLSGIISQMVKLPEFISYLKVRGSWASVGSAIAPNIASKWRYEYDQASQSYKTVTYKFPDTFYPERTNSWEGGISAKFFKNAFSVDLTFYQSNTKNQTFLRQITAAEGYDREYIQTGNVRNRGLELTLGYNKTWKDFTWNSTFTYSMNRNKIIDLLEDPKEVLNQGGLKGADIILKKGGTMGDLYTSTGFKYDLDGNLALDANGNVIKETLNNPTYMGSVLPKGNLGFSNDFTWKGINLGFLVTARLGGIVVSQTQALLDSYGVSQASADARNNGGIPVNHGMVNPEGYYAVTAGENPIWSEYTYSATNVRLQELHIGYNFPKKWLGGLDLNVSVTANNLWMLYCKAPFDPESTASTGTYYQGFDYFMQPSLRSLGFNIKLKF